MDKRVEISSAGTSLVAGTSLRGKVGAQTLLGLQNDDGSWGRYPATDEEWGDAAAYHSAPLGNNWPDGEPRVGLCVWWWCGGGGQCRNVDGNLRTCNTRTI